MVFGAIGCNRVGIVDAAMYCCRLVERSRAAMSAAVRRRGRRPTLRVGRAALAVFFLVFTSTFPVVVPFSCSGRLPRFAACLEHRAGDAVSRRALPGRHAGLSPFRLGAACLGVVCAGSITISLGG